MRTIKFRAWDGLDYMTKPFTLLDIQNGKIQFASSDTVVMQYTGLKDKNGKEIFEGDVVKSPFGTKAEIVFGYHTIGEDSWQVGHKTPCFCLKFSDGSGYTGLTEECEVIGNIYASPELLNP